MLTTKHTTETNSYKAIILKSKNAKNPKHAVIITINLGKTEPNKEAQLTVHQKHPARKQC